MKIRHIFPHVCMVCLYNVSHEELPVCSACVSQMQTLVTAPCKTCGQPPSSCRCVDNDKIRFGFFFGNSISRDVIYMLKNRIDIRSMDFIAELAVNSSGINIPSYDAVTYVPRLKRRVRRAGRDQACEFAKSLSRIYGIPMIETLERVGGVEQKLLSRDQRIKNIAGKFRVKDTFPEEPEYKKLLLVDDVATTGATITACASLLRGRVSRSVVMFTLAKTNTLKKKGV